MNCLFCSIPEMSVFENSEDEILDETEHFYAKAALGHFVYGYTLVISKEHFLSFAYLPEQLFPELTEFIDSVTAKLIRICGNPVTVLEHGAINRPQRAGACIDHAHLHLMPLSVDLYALLQQTATFLALDSIEQISGFKRAQISYLYYRTRMLGSHAAKLSYPVPSQLLRRIACEALGMPELWDWREKPLRQALEQFKNEYKSLNIAGQG